MQTTSSITFAPRLSSCVDPGPTPRSQLGGMVGTSAAMQTTFALLERAAASEATVLVEGETGTGKELAARALHAASRRREQPFVTVDSGALPANLIESELFGHERGAFTGASERRVGSFEEATGGTIFLDEIGELPMDVQPKLLRVLERREIRRVGANRHLPVDVRVIAATNRDLAREVAAGRFRSDLYFRLAVVKVALPPLRARPEDVPRLVDHLLEGLGASGRLAAALHHPDFLARLARAPWPGNVRELRNYLEACLVFGEALPLAATPAPAPAPADEHDAPDGHAEQLTLPEARRRALDDFERRYVSRLMARHDGKVARVARMAGVDRAYIYRILRRHFGFAPPVGPG
jgi:two-component system response regulator GlrR